MVGCQSLILILIVSQVQRPGLATSYSLQPLDGNSGQRSQEPTNEIVITPSVAGHGPLDTCWCVSQQLIMPLYWDSLQKKLFLYAHQPLPMSQPQPGVGSDRW